MIACPARVLMCAGSGQHMDGDISIREEGTAAHWVVEQWARNCDTPDVGTLAPNGVAVTAEMQAAATVWLDHLYSWGELFGTYIEKKMPVPQVPRCFGTPDASGTMARVVRVSDFKYGYRAVDVWPNYQLALYAAAVAAHDNVPLDAETVVVLGVYQPRAWHRGGPLRTATVTGADVMALVDQVTAAAYAALLPEPPAIPGEHCRFCSGRARCDALRNVALSPLVIESTQDVPPQFLERELSFLLSQKELLDAYVSGITLEIEHQLKNGGTSQIFEMRRSAGRLEWIPGQQPFARAIAAVMGQNIDAPPDLITPTQAREKLGAAVDAFSRRSPGTVKLAKLTPANKLFS